MDRFDAASISVRSVLLVTPRVHRVTAFYAQVATRPARLLGPRQRRRIALATCAERTSSAHNRRNLPAYLSTLHTQPPYAYRQLEPPRTRAARIETKHSAPRFLLGNVTVPIDHRCESRRLKLQIKLPDVMPHLNRNAANFDDLRFRQLPRPRAPVDVPAHCRQRRDLH